jgi:hypothetical protein
VSSPNPYRPNIDHNRRHFLFFSKENPPFHLLCPNYTFFDEIKLLLKKYFPLKVYILFS